MSRDLRDLTTLTGRHMRLYFKDKQSFLTSLITPLILIVLFVTFLKNVYESSLESIWPKGMELDQDLLHTFSAAWLITSILGVTCVTLAFCANTIMVSDKTNHAITDVMVTPVSRVVVSLSYFIANFLSTLLVCVICLVAGSVYIASNGWYVTGYDMFMIILNMFLCIGFGTLLASIVESFINSNGGASAVATLVSSMYGFICGAYMPISQFSSGIQNFVALVPGTHGTVLFRYYFMHGIIDQIGKSVPKQVEDVIAKSFDNKLSLFDHELTNGQMFAVLGGSCIVLLAAYILLVFVRNRRSNI